MTRFLLDTCTLIWLATEPEKLSPASVQAMDDTDSVLLWSDVSSLEIVVKWSAGKLALPDPPRHWLESQIDAWSLECLSLRRTDIYRASELPTYHRDPFDRLLVAAAVNADATILTPDGAVHQYPVSCRW